MSTLEFIEQEIKTLPRQAAAELHEWLADYLDDQEEVSDAFAQAIDRGKEDVLDGRSRTI